MQKNFIKDLLDSNKYLTTDFITDRFNTEFYLPGTIVEMFTPPGFKPFKLENYVIDKVTFRLGEKHPLYSIKKHWLNDDGLITNFNYDMVSHSMLTVKKDVELSVVEVGTYDISTKDNKPYVSAIGLLDNKTFLWLEQLVYLNLDIMNENVKPRMVSHICIDNDLNVYYQLDKQTNMYYTYTELSPLLVYDDENTTKLNLIQIRKAKGTINE
jgi:hypothetical protein